MGFSLGFSTPISGVMAKYSYPGFWAHFVAVFVDLFVNFFAPEVPLGKKYKSPS